jgi:hypothetical protein
VEGSKFQPVLRAFGTKGFDIGDVEDELHEGLAACLPFGRLMDHQIDAAIAADQFDDPVTRLPGRLKAEVPLVEADGLLYIPRVKHYSVYWQCRPVAVAHALGISRRWLVAIVSALIALSTTA